MITTSNYFPTIEKIGFENLPLPLQQAHTVILVKTDQGADWSRYDQDREFRDMVDAAFSKLDKLVKNKGLSGASKGKRRTAKKYLDITTEVFYIQRFLDLHNHRIGKARMGKFIDQLQQAIRKGKISKDSPVADEITQMQDFAVGVYNRMSGSTLVVANATLVKHLRGAVQKHEQAKKEWKTPRKSGKKDQGLSGLSIPNGKIMCSTDFTKIEFDSLGFKDRWLQLIGDPCKGFTCMIFGMPKMGKSYLAVDFAGYLCRNHGPVLYVAKEEKLDATLQKKLREKEVTHPDLFVSDHLPGDLGSYQFVFLDSVNKLRLTPQQLEKLQVDNPGTSFVYIFQTRKDGRFRGANQFQHDVDVVIEIPKKGKAVQFGRFNQGGEMEIFPAEDLPVEESSVTLAGVDNIKKLGKKLDVKVETYEWGTLVVLTEGASWTAVLHPEHLEAISKLDVGESTDIRDEQKGHWRITNNGNGFNLQSTDTNQKGHFKLSKGVLHPKKNTSKRTSSDPEKALKKFADREDELNPIYLFSTTASQLLSEALKGKFDLDYLVRRELANRGLDKNGKWVGFEKAGKLHRIG